MAENPIDRLVDKYRNVDPESVRRKHRFINWLILGSVIVILIDLAVIGLGYPTTQPEKNLAVFILFGCLGLIVCAGLAQLSLSISWNAGQRLVNERDKQKSAEKPQQ